MHKRQRKKIGRARGPARHRGSQQLGGRGGADCGGFEGGRAQAPAVGAIVAAVAAVVAAGAVAAIAAAAATAVVAAAAAGAAKQMVGKHKAPPSRDGRQLVRAVRKKGGVAELLAAARAAKVRREGPLAVAHGEAAALVP